MYTYSTQEHLDIVLPAVLLSEEELKAEREKLTEQSKPQPAEPETA